MIIKIKNYLHSSLKNKTQFEKIKLHCRKSFKYLLSKYYKKYADNQKFCIISNDCWGAEIYKLLDRPFNTPFIGLMLMGPCYIKLLENLHHNLSRTLVFKLESKYTEMQLIKSGEAFPMALLEGTDIEIHFLHYKTKSEAFEKWNRRVERMDWNNLFIKYDCGKDYGSAELIQRFLNLKVPNKMILGKVNYDFNEVIRIPNYEKDAVQQFKNCFLIFDPIGWLKGETNYTSSFRKKMGRLAFRYL